MSLSSHDRTQVFANKDRQTRIWRALCLLCILVYTAISWQLLSRDTGGREYLIVSDDTIFLGTPLAFGKAEELHNRQTIHTLETLFNRHPGGIDHPQRIPHLFVDAALEKAKTAVASDLAEFRQKQLHQKVEVASVSITRVNKSSILASVTGQLIRTGHFEGVPFTEALEIKAHFAFRENLSLTRQSSFPTLVTDFNYQTTPLDPK